MKKRIRGEQLFVFAGDDYTPLGASTDCTLRLESERIELCALLPHEQRSRAGKMQWGVSCQHFLGFDGCLRVGQPIRVVLSVIKKDLIAAGANLPLISPFGDASLRGEGIITEITFSGSVGGVVTYKLDIQSNGYMEAWVDDGLGFPYSFPLIFS